MSQYPPKLAEIIDLFEHLPEEEKRENLIAYADQAGHHSPKTGSSYDLEDVRKDEECTDTVGIFLSVAEDQTVDLRVSLGAHVQTLTRAMTSILCTGLKGASIRQILDVSADFVPKLVGGELVRARSQTVYYILTRIRSACKVWLDRKRAADLGITYAPQNKGGCVTG